MKTYIYVLKDPINQHIRYVGKTVYPKNRFKSHKCLKAKKGTHIACWVESLRAKNLIPVMEIIDESIGKDWGKKEQHYIEFYRNQGCNLVNLTSGGEGCAGYKHSDEIRKKMSEIKKGIMPIFIPSMKGRKHTEESKNKASASQLGEKNHQYGKKVADSTKVKISERLGKQVIIDNMTYPSLRKSAESLNIPWGTFKYRYRGIYF